MLTAVVPVAVDFAEAYPIKTSHTASRTVKKVTFKT